jgi:hypothetical protein
MNILVVWMMVDEFHPLQKNFNKEIPLVINGKSCNGLNEYLGRMYVDG